MNQQPLIRLSEPRPLVDMGVYRATCTAATCAWASQYRKWKAILVLELHNYTGKPYHGNLCAFFNLGANREHPHAGPKSNFRRLVAEVNGDQRKQIDVRVLEGREFDVFVRTVTHDKHENKFPVRDQYSAVKEIHAAGQFRFDEISQTFEPLEPFNPVNPITPYPTTPQPNNPLGKGGRERRGKKDEKEPTEGENVSSCFRASELMDLSRVPVELRERAQWVPWRYQQRTNGGKPTKPPINPATGYPCDPTDPKMWGTCRAALEAALRWKCNGIGFVFCDDDPYTGVDLDECRNSETGDIKPWGAEIIATLDSYAEISPSEEGVKVWVRGTLPLDARNKTAYQDGEVEMYSRSRYFTVTCAHVNGTPRTINERQTQLEALHARIFGTSGRRVASLGS